MFGKGSRKLETIIGSGSRIAGKLCVDGTVRVDGLIEGDIEATPRVNAAYLTIGAVIANLFGTTGASMLLLRPLLRTNRERTRVAHIPLFFILIVGNAGGMLTPLGDPPLFLGYLRGVPFFWTLRLWPIWLLANAWLIALFLFVDTRAYRREPRGAIREDRRRIEPLRLKGVFSAALLFAVGASAMLPRPWREIVMVSLAALSYWRTPVSYHKHNHFDFGPIREVAILFAGIFVTMVPALGLVHDRAASMGITRPWQFFWLTGILSSFLDNAPTYLTFLSTASGLPLQAPPVGGSGVPDALLAAISVGAVMMGANTYIGNGPNFMVKSIAESQRIRMPSFFGYMAWSVGILVPLFLVVSLVFFS